MALTSIVVIAAALRSGASTFPATQVPVGVSAIKIAADRTSMVDPALRVSWALELSIDGGATWIPWGAAETAGGPVADPGPKGVVGESSFSLSLIRRLRDGSIEQGFEPTNLARRMRGSLFCSQPVTTKVTVTLDDAPVPAVIAVPPEHQSVSFDNVTSIVISSVQTITTSAFIITSASNRAGLLGLSAQSNGASAHSGSIGGVAGALITGTDSGAAAASRTLMFGVTAPPSGSQTATMSWTTNTQGTLGVVTASGVDQVTPFNNGTFATTPGTPLEVTITSAVGDMTCDTAAVNTAVLSAPTQTQRWNLTSTSFGCGSTGGGTGTALHSWSENAGETNAISGANFVRFIPPVNTPPHFPRWPSRLGA